MSDGEKAVERWYSDRVQSEITVVRWGTFGTPVLVLPSAGGDAEEIERFGLVSACGPLLAEGRVKLYSVDSVAGQAMVRKTGSAAYRMWLLNQFHECVRWEVVPAIHADLGGRAMDVIACGASIGAFNALAVLCRYPDVFVSCGVYEPLIVRNRSMVPTFESAGMTVRYVEARDGHSWENWRDRLREGLSWIFPGPQKFFYE